MSKLVRALRSGQVLLMDGAMGTELARLNNEPKYARLTEPERVAMIHSWYTAFKADVLLTNTFQVNPVTLGKRFSPALHRTLWRSAIDAARCASPVPSCILGDVGPIPDCSIEVVAEVLNECRNLDGVLLETWSSPKDLQTFAKAATRATRPLLVSFTYYRDRKHGWRTFTDVRPEACAKAAQACGVTALGVNCGRNLSMKSMRDIVRRYRDVCDLPVFVRPNAGTPKKSARGWEYPRTAEAMADDLGPLLEEGIAMVGGCCGTTPEHIWRFRLAIDAWTSANPRRTLG